MTPQELARCTGARIDRATEWLAYIEAAMCAYDINTPARQAAFLAQIGHESGGLHWSSELWGPTSAQAHYEGRTDLGNIYPGDGEKFKGHGLIQTTGRTNHAAARDRLRAKFPDLDVPDFEEDPESLAWPQWAALSAAQFWADHDLNTVADIGDFINITKKINGGTNGLADRQALYAAAKAVLS